MEKNLKLLENRLKKLESEHEGIKRDLSKTEKMKEKALEYKKVKEVET